MRAYLRSLPVFAGTIADFDAEGVPDDPATLFAIWLRQAVDAGVPEPHAMTLSTIDDDAAPDARVLILKDLDDVGWWFASSADSAKGLQLAGRRVAALTFYWPQLARQVRVRGPVILGSADRSGSDFRSRSAGAKAVALASKQSRSLADHAECADAVTAADRRLAAEPDLISSTWQMYAVAAHTVEFWQADKDRLHTRVQFRRNGDRWDRGLLWP